MAFNNSSEVVMPKVSVIVPVYNVSKFLPKCLDSLIHQTLDDIEIIVVNDGSTDNSLEIIKNYAEKDSRIKLIDKPNSGYGNSMNRGLSVAKGEYIGIVESDDFVAWNMFEKLYSLTLFDTDPLPASTNSSSNNQVTSEHRSVVRKVDVVKGNFYDLYEEEGKVPRAVPNNERDMIEESRVFTLKEDGQILWGHPSVWSAIYRREFLVNNGIKFIEEKGGGWVDNPFFFETLAKAESIRWTRTPYYFYFRGNPNSSSNRQKDATLPIRRMLDNLKILKNENYNDGKAVICAYARALMYLEGTLKDFDFDANEMVICQLAEKMFQEINPEIMKKHFNISDQLKYFNWLSPIPKLMAQRKKVLFYNWVPFDNPWHVGGGVTVYLKNLIEEIIKSKQDVSVYMISSGFAYDATKLETFTRKIGNCFGDDCKQYEIVNSPVPAEQRFIFKNPLIAIENKQLKETFKEFLKTYGPFEIIHFNNIEGLSLDVLELKKDFPETKFIFSIHNYVPMCLTGFYYMRHKHCICSPNHENEDCLRCSADGKTINFATEIYNRGKFGVKAEDCYSQNQWLNSFNLNRLDNEVSADEVAEFSKQAISNLNKYCDVILAVSKRVKEIALDNGFDKEKTFVSYIGTKVAAHQLRKSSSRVGEDGTLKIVFLGNDINNEEKGYPFFIRTLEAFPKEYAQKIELVLTVRQKEHKELYEKFNHFKSVNVINGYTHKDLEKILKGCNLSIVPVLWEDNLPQIAIESVAYGVPVLSSNAGGAKELCASELFIFRSGDSEDLISKICHFLDHPRDLEAYWLHHAGLPTMIDHVKELTKWFGICDENNKNGHVIITSSDFSLLLEERNFYQNMIKSQIQNQLANPEQVNELYREKFELEKKIKDLNSKIEILKKAKRDEDMSNFHGKIIFTEKIASDENVGATLFKIKVPKFECSDLVAEISFVQLNNISPSVFDNLKFSGSWLKDNNGQLKFVVHQSDWQNKTGGLDKWINISLNQDTIMFIGKYNSQFSGYFWKINSITTRAKEDKYQILINNPIFVNQTEYISISK